ncbi:hypothetical protein QVN49_06990, partial [Megasphaera hexanoica]|nr:hypothetical protein [Megasphaera hexanoica]
NYRKDNIMTRQQKIDYDMTRELELAIENDSCYYEQIKNICRSLERKISKGTYESKKHLEYLSLL